MYKNMAFRTKRENNDFLLNAVYLQVHTESEHRRTIFPAFQLHIFIIIFKWPTQRKVGSTEGLIHTYRWRLLHSYSNWLLYIQNQHFWVRFCFRLRAKRRKKDRNPNCWVWPEVWDYLQKVIEQIVLLSPSLILYLKAEVKSSSENL
jgi:hypothetical protein